MGALRTRSIRPASARAFVTLSVLAAALLAGCGQGSEPTPARSASAVHGSSFDAPVAPKPAEQNEEVAAGVQPPASAPRPASNPPTSEPKEEPAAPTPVAEVAKPVENSAPAPSPAPIAPALSVKETISPPPAPKAAEAEVKKDGANDPPLAITFAKLSAYRYYAPAERPKPGVTPAAKSAIPDAVRALDGRKITIEGYMIPIDFEKGKIMTFILSKAMFGCCFGDSPKINEVIKVVSADGKPMSFQATPRVTGTLEVGEEFDADGYIESIYRIKADAVSASK